jgi:RNase P subunit RPR2
MAARNSAAWIKRQDGSRELVCNGCGKKRFRLSWEAVQRQVRVKTAHHRRIVARCTCGWETRVALSGAR